MADESGVSVDTRTNEDDEPPVVPEEVLEGIDDALEGELATEEEVRDAFLSE